MFARILVAVDLSTFSSKAAEYGAQLARMSGGEVTLLTVVNDVFPYFEFFPVEYASADYSTKMMERAGSELQKLADSTCGGVHHQTAIRRGYPATEIVAAADEGNFDVIVMATHGHSGLEHALLGSITEKVLRKAHVPVLVVR